MTRPRAPWQHPALAPVYAAVVAFGVVFLVHLFGAVTADVTVTVSVTPSAASASSTASARATTTVCLRPPGGWHLVDPKPQATPDPAAAAQDPAAPDPAAGRGCRPVVGTTGAPFRLRADGP
ncbi:hypothetical protein [Frankia sp. AgB32]|uniref:hypothetical protein n=1 Tax=Frankia sp. AgB32 TaxID=631119 RepID=UPI00200E264F|nr:hypothetical protein [Frankia sp. AgB32]MCK9896595.1 hypothetical protein [Frankia sp. AgB32]